MPPQDATRSQALVARLLVAAEPVRAFPAGLLAQDGTQRLQATVERRDAGSPARLTLVERMSRCKVLRRDFEGEGERVPARPELRTEAPDVHRPQVELRLAIHDPASHLLSDG